MLTALLVISLLETTTANLVCLYCTDAVAPADCGTVIRCGPHERCYVDTYVSAAGSIRYNLGCRDENQCNGSPNVLGKRKLTIEFLQANNTEEDAGKEKHGDINTNQNVSQKMSSGITGSVSKRDRGFLACSECCSHDLCTNNGCGNNGYSAPRGPICYQCDAQNDPEDCSKIRLCGQGEVCILQKVLNPMSHAVRYTTQCIGENKCLGEIQRYQELISLLIGKRRAAQKRNLLEINGSCIVQCCKSDLCNINCNDNMSTKPTIAPVASSSVSRSSERTTSVTFTSSTSAAILASATSQTPTSSSPTTTSYNKPQTVRVLSTYDTPEPPTKTSWKLSSVTMATHQLATTKGPVGCFYENELHREGETWNVGCERRCTCLDGKNHIYQCRSLCYQWNLPSVCNFSPPLPGKCCPQPVCPNYVVIQYPTGYSQN